MVNQIKEGGDGDLRLQITKEARRAGLVHENADGDPTQMAEVYVYTFDGLLMLIDSRLSMGLRADLISQASELTESMHTGVSATVSQAGNGYQVNLPGAKEAGFTVGIDAPVIAGEAILWVHDGSRESEIEALHKARREQSGPGEVD